MVAPSLKGSAKGRTDQAEGGVWVADTPNVRTTRGRDESSKVKSGPHLTPRFFKDITVLHQHPRPHSWRSWDHELTMPLYENLPQKATT